MRNEEKNVIYTISGDMFRGSLIDSEFQGISTIEIMNLLAPDVVSLGNHEVDYGLAHLLFLEKCATFPIVNANMYLTHIGFEEDIIMERYHFLNIGEFLDIRPEEIEKNGKPEEAATRTPNVLQEYFSQHELLKLDGEARLIIHA